MTSLRQHFEYIKAIVDWSWTLAILLLIGYITLGQLVQLYWAMVFFGGLAASFGLFYDFSCEKLRELNYLDSYELQKAYIKAEAAQKILRQFATKNPGVAHDSLFIQAKEEINNIKTKSNEIYKVKVNEQQRKASQQKPTQPPPQRTTQPSQRRPEQKQENTLAKERKKAGETRGYPPYPNNPKIPPPGYPIKVTKNLTGQKHKGIYYTQDDPDYHKYDAHWWFESEEAVPKHKYRKSRRGSKKRKSR